MLRIASFANSTGLPTAKSGAEPDLSIDRGNSTRRHVRQLNPPSSSSFISPFNALATIHDQCQAPETRGIFDSPGALGRSTILVTTTGLWLR